MADKCFLPAWRRARTRRSQQWLLVLEPWKGLAWKGLGSPVLVGKKRGKTKTLQTVTLRVAILSDFSGKVDFGTGTGQKAFFDFFGGLILDPPRYICFYSEKRQIRWYRPFFPHCMAFLEKGEGLVPVYVFLCPVFLPEDFHKTSAQSSSKRVLRCVLFFLGNLLAQNCHLQCCRLRCFGCAQKTWETLRVVE